MFLVLMHRSVYDHSRYFLFEIMMSIVSSYRPFKYLPLVQRREIAALCVGVRFATGEFLLRQDELNNAGVYIVLTGAVYIVDTSFSPPKV